MFIGRTKEQDEYDQNLKPRDCSCGMHIYSVEYGYHLKSGEHNQNIRGRTGQIT